MSGVESAFDAAAGAYDQRFTGTIIGTLMRRAVWSRCEARFAPGSRVLEMNCGTGEDAAWLVRRGVKVLATDISPAMLRVAEAKMANIPGRDAAEFRRLAWEDLDALDAGPFDGLLSNFGGLNCVADLRAIAAPMAAKLRRGATAILCIMGPTVPWEWAWFLAQARPGMALRRLRHNGAKWSNISIHYPSIAATRRALGPEFRVMRVSAIGALLPPPYAEKRLTRHPRLLAALNRVERRFETRWPLPLFADHYLMELLRV